MITIPASVQRYFPKTVDSAELWVNYNSLADSLTIYFTGQPVLSVWSDIDRYTNIGFALKDETPVIGVMIEHFSKWLLLSDQVERQLEPA